MKMNWFFWIQRIITWFSDLLQYKRRYLELKLNNFEAPIDYSFIPDDWDSVRADDVITGKVYDGAIQLHLDIRDLFNSTIYTRQWADAVLNEVGNMKAEETPDEFFNRLALSAANLTLQNINYMTNQAQFSMSDKWTNGDSAIETGKGDCDISVRVFVRTMYDVLARLNMWQYRKYVFQCVGFFSDVGHSWASVYDPVEEKFKLVECTKDQKLGELPNVPSIYKLYFCFNYSKIFYQKANWRIFL